MAGDRREDRREAQAEGRAVTDEQIVRALYERLVRTFARGRIAADPAPTDSVFALEGFPEEGENAGYFFNTFPESNETDRDDPNFLTGRISIRGETRKIQSFNPSPNTVNLVPSDSNDPESGPLLFTPEVGEYVYGGKNIHQEGSATDPRIELDSGGFSEIDDRGWPGGRFIARNRQVYLLPDDEANQAIPVPGLPLGAKILPRIEAETLPIEPEQLSLNPMGSQRRRFLFVASAVVGLDQARSPGKPAGGQFEAQKIAEKIAEQFEVGYGQRGEAWPYYDLGRYFPNAVSGLWVRARPQIGPGFVLTDANEWRLPVTIRLETLRP